MSNRNVKFRENVRLHLVDLDLFLLLIYVVAWTTVVKKWHSIAS